MKKVVLVSIGLTVFAIALVIILSVSGRPAPEAAVEETPESAPPDVEELIPQGARSDKDMIVRVLLDGQIIEMTMEKFLIGVLSAEMPASFEQEALKAQAVAARTDILYYMRVSPSGKHPGADVCGDYSCCMAYTNDGNLRDKWGDSYVENVSKIIMAVIDTDGVYMEYDGLPILAVFHSSSAGMTESSENVWGAGLPYLVGVKSPETPDEVPNFISTVTVSASDFKDTVLREYPDAVFGEDITLWITEITRTESGRIGTLTVGGAVIAGTRLRVMFGLRSTAVSIEVSGGDFVLTTTGYGHGVGMSQYGANTMALEGKGFREILAAYYTGVSFAEEKQASSV